jgi:hypothetical protein
MLIDPLERRTCLAPLLLADITFGDAGTSRVGPGGDLNVTLNDSRGRTILVATTGDIEFGPFDTRVTRLTARGDRDDSFGRRGSVFLDGGHGSAAVIQDDDKVVIVSTGIVRRLTADGRLDPTFGDNGVVRTPVPTNVSSEPDVRVLRDGKVRIAFGASTLYQLDADGGFDESFAPGGRVTLPTVYRDGLIPLASDDTFRDVQLDVDGRPHLFLNKPGTLRTYLARLTEAGALDRTFSRDGVADLDELQDHGGFSVPRPQPPQLSFGGRGQVVAAFQPLGLSASSHRLVRFDDNGRGLANFGDRGRVDYVPRVGRINRLDVQTDQVTGNLYVITNTVAGDRHLSQTVRLRPNGKFDARFGRPAVQIGTVTANGRLFAGGGFSGGVTRYAFRESIATDRFNRLFLTGTDGDDTFELKGGTMGINVNTDGIDSTGFAEVRIMGGGGNDRVVGLLPFRTLIDAGEGDDSIRTAGGHDTIFGGGGDDSLYGFGGDDVIDGGTGANVIEGGSGDDTLVGGSGRGQPPGVPEGENTTGGDTLIAGSGNDVVRLSYNGPNDGTRTSVAAVVSLGVGNDRLKIENYTAAKVEGNAGDDTVDIDALAGFCDLVGGAGSDTVLTRIRQVKFRDLSAGDRILRGYGRFDEIPA